MQELLGRKDQLHKAVHKNFEGLEYLKSTNINYNIIAISDTRTMKHLEISQNINLKNYNFEYTPSVTLTESTSGGIMLYIANHLPYKPRHDLKIYKTNELESTFIELKKKKKKKQNVLSDLFIMLYLIQTMVIFPGGENTNEIKRLTIL